MDRARGLSVRLKLTLSYAGFLVLAGASLLALWALLLRYFPGAPLMRTTRSGIGGALLPGRSPDQQAFGEAAAIALAFLLVFGLAGGWILAGRMLAPLARITDATRTAAAGSLSHRIRLQGRSDEFRELAKTIGEVVEVPLPGRLEGLEQTPFSRLSRSQDQPGRNAGRIEARTGNGDV